MIKTILFDQKEEWGKIVTSFENHDVYYYHGYLEAFKLHGDGEPILVYYEDVQLRGMYVAMRRDIASLPWVLNRIEPQKWFDLSTPYGYGGWVFEGEVTRENLLLFNMEYKRFMREHNFVSNFVRYSPVLKNAETMKSICKVIDLGKTIDIDLSNESVIWDNIISKNRNMIRKAIKMGVTIEHSKPTPVLMKIFKRIYDDTMKKDNAAAYYFFNQSFYQSMIDDFSSNSEVFYALYEGEIIAISIILYGNGLMHYHLSGTVSEFRRFAPTNLLLYEAALWGCRNGFKVFHLGGGVGSGEDSLYKFKAAFNRNSDMRFSIGQEIFNREMYDKLISWRSEVDTSFDSQSSFFPLYRQQEINDSKIRKIAVFGAGGLGREVAGAIARINSSGQDNWNFIGFFDDKLKKGTKVSHYGSVLGGMDELNSVEEPLALAIAVGDPQSRKSIFDKIKNKNLSFPNLIAPSFKILDHETFKIGRGNIIQDNCSATCDVIVGDFNVFNGSNVLGHDVIIGDFNVLMPSVHLSGAVHIGNCNLLGVDSVVLQRIKIGENVTLGAGSVLMSNPKNGFTYIGIPAKKFEYD